MGTLGQEKPTQAGQQKSKLSFFGSFFMAIPFSPRMRNSEGVSEGGKHQKISAVTENDPGPAEGPGTLLDSGVVCCDAWREGRRTRPVPGCMHARKMRATNGGRPSGPTTPGHPIGLPPGAAAHTWGAMHNGTSGPRARSKGLPCCRGGVAPKPENAVIPHSYRFRNQNGYERAGLWGHGRGAHRTRCRCAAGFGTGLAAYPAHGGGKSPGIQIVTLCTPIAQVAGRATTVTGLPLQTKRGRREPVSHGCRAWDRQGPHGYAREPGTCLWPEIGTAHWRSPVS